MEQLTDILVSATKAVPKDCFLLSITGGDPVSRERVYCYELYHQMRGLWPLPCEFTLSAEVDKQGHRLMEQMGLGDTKPDMIVHVPGSMENNQAIIEVKRVGASLKDIATDLSKLCRFQAAANYRRGIYLFYGADDAQKTLERVTAAYNELPNKRLVEVWLHAAQERSAERVAELHP
jgi:hypothetical protein